MKEMLFITGVLRFVDALNRYSFKSVWSFCTLELVMVLTSCVQFMKYTKGILFSTKWSIMISLMFMNFWCNQIISFSLCVGKEIFELRRFLLIDCIHLSIKHLNGQTGWIFNKLQCTSNSWITSIFHSMKNALRENPHYFQLFLIERNNASL